MNLYKATRMDGTDFFTGTLSWLPEKNGYGRMVDHPNHEIQDDVDRWFTAIQGIDPDDAGTYLSVATKPTSCTGMQWPCRLFEVQPVSPLLVPDPDDLPDKRAAKSFWVVKELPAWKVFGEHGENVVRLMLDFEDHENLAEDFGEQMVRESWGVYSTHVDYIGWMYDDIGLPSTDAMWSYVHNLFPDMSWNATNQLLQFMAQMAVCGPTDAGVISALNEWENLKAGKSA